MATFSDEHDRKQNVFYEREQLVRKLCSELGDELIDDQFYYELAKRYQSHQIPLVAHAGLGSIILEKDVATPYYYMSKNITFGDRLDIVTWLYNPSNIEGVRFKRVSFAEGIQSLKDASAGNSVKNTIPTTSFLEWLEQRPFPSDFLFISTDYYAALHAVVR